MQIKLHQNLLTVCERYQLGEPLHIQKIPGGLLHQTWYLKASTGDYAIKVLDANHNKLNQSLLSTEQSQLIAEKMQMKGIRTVVAKTNIYQEFQSNIDQLQIVVFPWVEGINYRPNEISVAMAEQIGRLTAKIHLANVQHENLPFPNWEGYSESYWKKIIAELLTVDIHFAEKLQSLLPDLLAWSDTAQKGQQEINKLQQHFIVSHRDLDAKNILWESSSQPVLLDWEYSGLIHPALDLFINALNWSSITTEKVNMLRFKAVYQGYYQLNKNSLQNEAHILGNYIGYCLDWIEFNIRRFADSPEIGKQEINGSLRALFNVEDIFL